MANFPKEISTNFCQYRDLDGQNEKKNPQDFALWKKASRTYYEMDFTLGRRFPRLASRMSRCLPKYLGEQFDIHGGGMDL